MNVQMTDSTELCFHYITHLYLIITNPAVRWEATIVTMVTPWQWKHVSIRNIEKVMFFSLGAGFHHVRGHRSVTMVTEAVSCHTSATKQVLSDSHKIQNEAYKKMAENCRQVGQAL